MEGMFTTNNNDDSEQRGRYGNRKRLRIQRMKSIGSDGEVDEVKKDKLDAEPVAPVGIMVTQISVEEKELRNCPCASHGSVSICGRRRDMEDAVTVLPALLPSGFDFFGVYDGHGGSEVAYLCKERLHRVLENEVDGLDVEGDGFNWKNVMEGCFMKMDGEVDVQSVELEDMKLIGSTALVALVGTVKVVVANCGDSRAVLSRGGIVVPLSHDHKPDRPDEMERVEAAGGRVIDWDGFRVLGVLATSRSIGDYYLKPYVISEPEVVVMNRGDDDEFLILASDGLWDVLDNDFACDIVRRCFNGRIGRRHSGALVGGSVAAQAAAILAELAIARGSKDNISVVVIELKDHLYL